jgi:hypothetical protein
MVQLDLLVSIALFKSHAAKLDRGKNNPVKKGTSRAETKRGKYGRAKNFMSPFGETKILAFAWHS